MKKFQGAVAFVAFRHKIFSPRIPMGVSAEDRNFRAHIIGGMQAALGQNMRRHGGGRGLPVHSRNHDSSFARMIAARASARRNAGFPVWRAAVRIGLSALIADEKIISSRRPAVLRPMRPAKTQTKPLQPSGLLRAALSEPLTSCPSSSKSAARPLIPLPATPMRWIRCRSRVRKRERSRSDALSWAVYLSIGSRSARLHPSAPDGSRFPTSAEAFAGLQSIP